MLTGMMRCVLAMVVTAQLNPDRRPGQLIRSEWLQLRKPALRYERLSRLETRLSPLERRKLPKIKRYQRRQAARPGKQVP